MPSTWLTTREAAALLEVTPEHVGYLRARGLIEGRLDATGVRPQYLYSRRSVLHYTLTRRAVGRPKKGKR
jgi:hypothetical protein